jgi:hypothetical protein
MRTEPTQEEIILSMLSARDCDTADFCRTPPLAAAFRSRIADINRKGKNHITSKPVRRGRWRYHLERKQSV